ncbi:MAG: antibiotic biosynthesis monooxygenase [Hyphomicrobiales bacterium]|nr:antibiotic biosynthesis monooxygenase [Hyphomicrobiales bacterium]
MTRARFAVVVDFDVAPERVEEFRDAIIMQARNSLELEDGCQQFDVFRDSEREATFVLYELYDDEAAFELHLKSDHFAAFDAHVQQMVRSRTIRRLRRV